MPNKKLDFFNNLNSGITHVIGAVIAIPCAVLLIVLATRQGPLAVVSFSIFGAALFLLYAASALYHFMLLTQKKTIVFRRIDHMMIFVLIAGTYTPLSLIGLGGAWGWSIFGVIWGMAVAGILFKVFWMNAPRILYTILYVVMGWTAVIAFYPMTQRMTWGMIALILGGGVLYTAGAVFYALKKPAIKGFGFHEIFHLFVLGGSACHIVFMFWLVMSKR